MSQQWDDTEPYPAATSEAASADGTPSAAPASGADAGLDPKIGGLLAYLLFGWIGGLIMLLTQKHREVRFHGAQSVLTCVVLVAVSLAIGVVMSVIAMIPGVGFIGAALLSLLYPLLSLAGLVLWVFLCIKGYNLEHFKLPVVGDIAERWAAN